MLDKIEAQLTTRRRKWAYRVAWAVLGVLGVYGVVSGEQLAAWLLLAAALLGMADAHTDQGDGPAPRRAAE